MKLTVHLVTWNGAKYVPHLFRSLRNQSFHDWELCVLDNASEDGMVQKMKEETKDFPVSVHIVENKENKGFAGGHNELFRETDSDYFLLLNQDMYLEPNCLEKLVSFLDSVPGAGAVSPRIMKWDFSTFVEAGTGTPSLPPPKRGRSLLGESFTNTIDTLGLQVFRNRRVIDMNSQEKWSDLEDTFQASFLEVFGVSGALPMFRRRVIKNICFADGSFFDESYHSYKEDVDLAFRLQAAGSRAYTLLDALAFHDRSAARPEELGDIEASRNKKQQSKWVKFHSYKNHLATLYKNEYWQNLILDFPFIFWYELKKCIYFLLFDREVLRSLGELWSKRNLLREERKQIVHQKKSSWREMRSWWTLPHVSQESYGVIPLRIKDGITQVFLIQQVQGHWDLPKGKKEKNEKPVQTALRELTEETGLTVEKVWENSMLTNSFVFIREGRKIHKIVGFFVALVRDEAHSLQAAELKDGGWFSLADAKQKVTFGNARKLLSGVELIMGDQEEFSHK